MGQATGHRGKKAPKRKVERIRIHKAANGYLVHHELEPQKKKGPGGGMMSSYEPDPPPNVFQDKQAMLDHIGGLADQMGTTSETPQVAPPTQAA